MLKSVVPSEANLAHVSNDHYKLHGLRIPNSLVPNGSFPFVPTTAVTHLPALHSTGALLYDCNDSF